MKFTTALNKAARAYLKSGITSTWSDSLKKAIQDTKAGLIKTIKGTTSKGVETIRYAYLKISDFTEIKGTGQSYNHLLKFICFQRSIEAGKMVIRSLKKENILELV